MAENRCVITGLGVISAIGHNVPECWENILASKSGIDHTRTLDTENCYADFAAEVRDFAETDPALDRATALCLKATDEAVHDAGLSGLGGDPRVSVIMGSCVGGGRSLESYYRGGKQPADVLKMPISPIANHVAAAVGAGGVVTNVANACAAGTISIAYASDLIRAGKADVVIAGGTDAFSSVPYSGFLSLHALDENSCSPFNHSHGITLGEGAGAVIVESYAHARARGAHIYCEVLGAGISSDAHHITAPRPDGEGQMNAIRAAIAHSGLHEEDVDYVNAHGTGTAKNDEAEFLSLHTIFDGKNDGLSVSSTKAMTGHCLGAAGAIEAVFAIKALTEDTVPPTLGYSGEDLAVLAEKAGKLDFVPNKPEKKPLGAVMNNSFAFGGNNASIIFSKGKGETSEAPAKKEIAVTGLGMVTPLSNGRAAYVDACKAGAECGASAASVIGTPDYDAQGLKMNFYRKLDHLSQLQAVSGMDALHDAKYEVTEENATRIGMIVGTSEGALGPSCEFQSIIAEKGNAGGSAFKFPNTVYNAAGGYLSICAGIKGYNVTVTNGAQSGLQSVAYAMQVIRNGWEDAMLATGTDENSEIISELYGKLNLTADEKVRPYEEKERFSLSDGSVSALLETVDSAKARGAELLCRVTGYGMAHASVPFGKITGSAKGLTAAVTAALDDAGLSAGDIDAVIGFANGHRALDAAETEGLSPVFDLTRVPVISVKERMGEGRAASATLGLAHAALLFHGDLTEEPDAYRLTENGMEKIPVKAEKLNRILAVSYAAGGSYTAIVLER